MSTAPISVVIPAYGRADLLQATLESVRAQTLQPAEIVVVDDGWRDDSVRAAALAAGARHVYRANGGEPAARNTGIAAAREPWIALLDSDDLWEPTKLERQYAVVRARPELRAVFCDFTYFDMRGPHATTALADHAGYAASMPESIAPGVTLLRDASRGAAREMYLQSSTLLVARELARSLPYDETMRYCTDYDFALRLLARTAIACVTESLVAYRNMGDGLSADVTKMRLGDLAVLAHAERDPMRYGTAATLVLRKRKYRLLFLLAVAHLRANRNGAAARSAFASLGARPTVRAAALVLLSVLGPLGSQIVSDDRYERPARG